MFICADVHTAYRENCRTNLMMPSFTVVLSSIGFCFCMESVEKCLYSEISNVQKQFRDIKA